MSSLNNLTLSDYIIAKKKLCSKKDHCTPCLECNNLLLVAETIIVSGFVVMSEAFRKAFPDIKYTAEAARRKFFQLPLVCIVIGDRASGRTVSYLLEQKKGTDYEAIYKLLSSHLKETNQSRITKSSLKEVLSIAQSHREKELIRYTAFISGNFSQKSARKELGLEGMSKRAAEVESCLQEAKVISETINEMATMEIANLDLQEIDSEDELTSEVEDDTNEPKLTPELEQCLIQSLRDRHFNWFDVISHFESKRESEYVHKKVLLAFMNNLLNYDFTEQEVALCKQSYVALQSDEQQHSYERSTMERLLNGDIITDSESDNPDLYFSQRKTAIKKKAEALRRSAMRRSAKRIAERRFLQRSYSRQVQSIVERYPDIGSVIEQFVQDCNVGADAWRRTGVLTFDGNLKVKKKATYNRIKQNLEEKYQCSFSYGSVVQLCVARNKRRLSSKRYKGVARVTSRRARKGFTLRYNPDAHWSAALYRGLNALQYTDGRNIININRDDASGYRLDTLTTHKQYRSLSVQGNDVLTTRTDYVNKYKSLLQTTSYNFSSTETTGEMCGGVVKAHGLYPKNPAQHAEDLRMLTQKEELKPVFVNMNTNNPKQITCVRVDGASDEGPSHHEVQFWWTDYHYSQGNYITLVTTRSSGSSYLNRVELQNGCLTQAHSNLFIPSTLGGSCFDPETGTLAEKRYQDNLQLATNVYIDRCNGCPCGDTVIHLYQGADSSNKQQLRSLLLTFLKGTQQKKNELRSEHPEEYSFFDTIWSLRNRHLVAGVSEQYQFHLRCCLQPNCVHPLCQKKQCDTRIEIPTTWYHGGPPISYLPLPIPDPQRTWGRKDCSECGELCSGHYLKPPMHLSSSAAHADPPSVVIQTAFTSSEGHLNDNEIEDLARRVLLPASEVKIWISHLSEVQQNRQRGALRAAETRKANRAKRTHSDCTEKRTSTVSATSIATPTVVSIPPTPVSISGTTDVTKEQECFCGVCGGKYQTITDDVEDWIACDTCDAWFHWTCVGLTEEPDNFLCSACRI